MYTEIGPSRTKMTTQVRAPISLGPGRSFAHIVRAERGSSYFPGPSPFLEPRDGGSKWVDGNPQGANKGGWGGLRYHDTYDPKLSQQCACHFVVRIMGVILC